MSGLNVKGICEILQIRKLPRELETYLFCCPSLDGNLRCLPRAGGYYGQFYTDIIAFRIIENKIFAKQNREYKKVERERKRIK